MYMYRVFNSDILWANAMLPLHLFFHSPHVFSSNEAEIQSYLWKTQAGSEDQVLGAYLFRHDNENSSISSLLVLCY